MKSLNGICSLGTAAALSLIGCSVAGNTITSQSKKCNASQARPAVLMSSNDESGAVATTRKPRDFLGGYIISTQSVLGAHLKTEKKICSVAVQLNNEISASTQDKDQQLVVWTSGDCIALGRLQLLQFARYDGSAISANGVGKYILDESFGLVKEISQNATANAILGVAGASIDAIKVFAAEIAEASSTIDAGWCKSNAASSSSAEQVCASTENLTRFAFSLPANMPQPLADLVAQLKTMQRTPTTDEIAWNKLHATLSERKAALAYARLMDKLRACAVSDSTALCKMKAIILPLAPTTLGKVVFASGSAADPEIKNNTVAAENFANTITTAQAQQRLESQFTIIAKALGEMKSKFESQTASNVFVQGNFVFSDNKVTAYTLGANSELAIFEKSAYLAIPHNFGLSTDKQARVSVRVGEKGIIIERPRDSAALSLENGETGSLLLFNVNGVMLPVGTVTNLAGSEIVNSDLNNAVGTKASSDAERATPAVDPGC
jgi:hypothetical protein